VVVFYRRASAETGYCRWWCGVGSEARDEEDVGQDARIELMNEGCSISALQNQRSWTTW
jgi:hypothetical protein